jgi:thiosulfate/3-mercaptopyruvate sulfurtransferase
MDYKNPHYLTSIESLQQQLTDPDLRVYDAAVFLTPQKEGGYQVDSGKAKYEEAHIPGAGFIDLIDAWAAPSSKLNFTLPDVAQLGQAIGASGIANHHNVVLYSSGHLMWATRAWWLLHFAGHSNISILNGNIRAWQAAGLAVEQGHHTYPAAEFTPAPHLTAFADTATVEAGMHGKVCTVNALTPALYEGTGDFYYKRRGHIPGSRSLYYDNLLDNEHFKPAAELAEALENHGMLSAEQVITYCGGGIAATLDGFACKLMGQDQVAIYDGSMSEWVQDDNRPLTVGPAP